MNKFLLLAIIVVTVFVYFAWLEPFGLAYIDLPFLLIICLLGIFGTKEALIAALVTGALVDFHHAYFGRYMLILAAVVLLTNIVNKYVLNSQTYRSLLLLYASAAVIYLALLYFITGFLLGFKYALFSSFLTSRLWLLVLIATVAVFVVGRLKNILNNDTIHDKQSF